MISKVRGTQDLLDLKLGNFIIDQAKKLLQNYNFKQIQTPILEHTKLFIRSLGQETDVVSKEMYIFPSEQKEDSTCLRPEATASTMRAFLENNVQEKPWQVFSYGSMFRHERPQKGRWREFTQISIEKINANSIAQDAYFITMIDNFFSKSLRLENYVLKINFLGDMDDRQNHKKELDSYLETIKDEICETCKVRREKNILRVFDCKNKTCQEFYKKAPKLTDCLSQESNQEWKELQETLQILSVNFIHDSYLVRGLDYYNKTVFEFCSAELGAQNAFAGGGRYNLSKALESKNDYPAVGAAIGLGRLEILVQNIQDKLNLPQEPSLNLILPMEKEQQTLALLLANELQTNNLCADVLLDEKNLKNMMRKANKLGAKYVLILGQEEQESNTVSIKNMQTGESQSIKQSEAIKFLKNK